MSKNIMDLTRKIRKKVDKRMKIPGFKYEGRERYRDSDALKHEMMVVDNNIGSTKLMNPVKNIISNICAELNKNEGRINYEKLRNLCDTILLNL